MLRVIIISILLNRAIVARLTGDNICQEEKRHFVNVTENYTRNTTVRSYQWCMHMPPRCSFYTTRLINETRVVPKEIVETVDKCCEGFEEDRKTQQCLRSCPNCVNGRCENGKCICVPGFTGELCDSVCALLQWGENCKFRCRCHRGTCDPKTGSCDCPSGWIGSKCQLPCQTGSYGKNCLESCECKANEFCHHETGECESPTAPITTHSSQEEGDEVNDDDDHNNGSSSSDKIESSIATTKTSSSTPAMSVTSESHTQKTTSPFDTSSNPYDGSSIVPIENNGQFIGNKNEIFIFTTTTLATTLSTTIVPAHVTVTAHRDDKNLEDGSALPPSISANVLTPITRHRLQNKDSSEEGVRKPFMNSKTTNPPIEIMKSSKAKANEKEVSVTNTGSSGLQKENYLNDEARKENVNQPPINQSDLVNGASAAAAISITIIALTVAIIVVNKCRRKRKGDDDDGQKKEEDRSDNKSKGVSTVAVFTHSIFHTPLPDPPTFENPVFITPIVETNPTISDSQRIETHVVCSMNMNFPSYPAKDPREYLYDHPPSTGSYRAASIPEPSDIDLDSLSIAEPVYDEIPAGSVPTPISEPPPYKSSLYMNTCGKTRL